MSDIDQTYLNLNTNSYHWNRTIKDKKDLNENNSGIGIEKVKDSLHKMAGIYKNSYGKNTLYGMLGYTPWGNDNLQFGPFIGAATGYSKAPIVPVAGGMLSGKYGDYGFNLILTPSVTQNGKHTVGFGSLQLKYLLK